MATKKDENELTPTKPLNYKEMNVYEKLNLARLDFIRADVKKTGKHMKPNYMYFTLADISPVGTVILHENRLHLHITFDQTDCIGTVINLDNPAETEVYKIPTTHIESIENKDGDKLTNDMQNLGSVQTYARRYMWLLVLDVVEHDDFDGNTDEGTPIDITPVAVNSAPVSSEERATIKTAVTQTKAMADELQLAALKTACEKWLDADPSVQENVNQIQLYTANFTAITKAEWEELITNINAVLGE